MLRSALLALLLVLAAATPCGCPPSMSPRYSAGL